MSTGTSNKAVDVLGVRCNNCAGPTTPDIDYGPQEDVPAEWFGWCAPCSESTFLSEANAVLTVDPKDPPTAAEINAAFNAGRAALLAEHPAAPGISPTIQRLVADATVGQGRTLSLFRAWTAGYRLEADAEWNADAPA